MKSMKVLNILERVYYCQGDIHVTRVSFTTSTHISSNTPVERLQVSFTGIRNLAQY